MWDIWQALGQLEERVRRLEAEHAELRRAPDVRKMEVKKLVYHIHALHIKEMRGTLNIGVTAPIDAKDMEQMEFELKQEEK